MKFLVGIFLVFVLSASVTAQTTYEQYMSKGSPASVQDARISD